MLEKFDFQRISLGGPVFDLTKLKWLNGEYLRALSPTILRGRAPPSSPTTGCAASPRSSRPASRPSPSSRDTDFFFKDDVDKPAEAFLPDAAAWKEALAFAAEQLAVLEATPFTHEELEAALKKLGAEKQWPVKDNFMLLRTILTGNTASPPLIESLIVFGKARSLDRLRRFLDTQKKLAASGK